MNKWDLIKLKRLCTGKETNNKTKRQPNRWEKIFANDVTDKRLTFRIYKQLIQLNIKIQATQLKMGRRPVQTFLQRKHVDGQQVHEKMLNIANYREMKIKKNTEESPHTCKDSYDEKKHRKPMMARKCRKENPHTQLLGMYTVQPLWRTVWRFLKQLKIELLHDPTIPLLDIYPKNWKH